VVTRTTFELGLAVGLGALLARRRAALARLRAVGSGCPDQRRHWFVPGRGRRRSSIGSTRDGIAPAVGGMVPTVAVGVAFGNGGRQSFAEEHALVGDRLSSGRWSMLAPFGGRWGAYCRPHWLSPYLLPTQVGTTATRLPELFGAPVIMAVSAVPLAVSLASTVATVALTAGVHQRGARTRRSALSAQFYAPLLEQLTARDVAGPMKSSQLNDAARLPSYPGGADCEAGHGRRRHRP
jgi:hypothetical protein